MAVFSVAGDDAMPRLSSVVTTPEIRPEGMALAEDDVGSGVAGASVSEVWPDIRECTAGSIQGQGGSLGGRIRRNDPAMEFFEQVARERGQSLASMLRESGILTRHQEQEIAWREVPMEDE